ncbi:hypothetical protein DIPPA_21972, partial [Diplonema papillatum]
PATKPAEDAPTDDPEGKRNVPFQPDVFLPPLPDPEGFAGHDDPESVILGVHLEAEPEAAAPPADAQDGDAQPAAAEVDHDASPAVEGGADCPDAGKTPHPDEALPEN